VKLKEISKQENYFDAEAILLQKLLMSFNCLRLFADIRDSRAEPIREPQASGNHELNHGYPRFDSVQLEQLYYGQWNNTKFNTEYHMYFEYHNLLFEKTDQNSVIRIVLISII
jgi:hypothetical protein